jgi:hypothetical protein
MAQVLYNQINNTCFNDNIGSIIIDQITFDSEVEAALFASYTIQWSGNFDSLSQISEDGRIVEFLRNDNYSFNIVSSTSSSILGPYSSTITSPPELKITDIKYNRYSCGLDQGSVRVYISGGTPPYVVSVGGVSENTSSNEVLLSGINPGDLDTTVFDANSCSHTFPSQVRILDSIIDVSFTEILPPTLYNSYGVVRFTVSGYGPFDMWFTNNDTNEITYINALATEYISQIISEDQYIYKIYDKLVPGNYSVIIKNKFGCSLETTLAVPNILPISVNCFITNDDREFVVNKQRSLPIFDTVLIPYKHIQTNSNLWKLVKTYNLKDTINISIDGNKKEYKIVRNMLDKYCLDENKIEILRLGNSSDEWFYYLYLAPSVNLATNFNLVNSQYQIVNTLLSESYPLTLGLDSDGQIDKENPSLIKGSFLLNGIDHNQFVNTNTYINFTDRKNNAYISFSDDITDDHDFFIENISKRVLKNVYAAGYVTAINFLEQFNRLSTYVNINDTACTISKEQYLYIVQTKGLLKAINNLNNINDTYIYNIDNISKIGQIVLAIDGQQSFSLEGGIVDQNQYDISYFTFDETSGNLSTFYQNNQLVKTPQLKNIGEGYLIIRIKDKYNNIPRTVTTNSINANYDDHFVSAKNIIQKFNRNITPYFNYGDILCYVGSRANPSPPIADPIVPSPEPPAPTPVIPPSDPIIEQTHDTSNTSALSVSLYKNIICTMFGPKNYQHSFNTDITFTNMVPGVYRIVGNDKELSDNNLYPQEFRIVIDKNTTNTIDIDFISYRDRVFTKEIT